MNITDTLQSIENNEFTKVFSELYGTDDDTMTYQKQRYLDAVSSFAKLYPKLCTFSCDLPLCILARVARACIVIGVRSEKAYLRRSCDVLNSVVDQRAYAALTLVELHREALAVYSDTEIAVHYLCLMSSHRGCDLGSFYDLLCKGYLVSLFCPDRVLCKNCVGCQNIFAAVFGNFKTDFYAVFFTCGDVQAVLLCTEDVALLFKSYLEDISACISEKVSVRDDDYRIDDTALLNKS